MYEKYVDGEQVWCYSAPCFPRKAKIIREHQTDYWQVEHLEGRDKIRCYCGFQIFKDINKLIDELRQDSYNLERYAKELEELS